MSRSFGMRTAVSAAAASRLRMTSLINSIRLKPFDQSHISRDGRGIAHYTNRPHSLVAMLRQTVDSMPGAEAIVELGGGRITYREFWDRAARIAGGLRASGIKQKDRVAIRLPNSLDWCLAFFGIQLAGAVA